MCSQSCRTAEDKRGKSSETVQDLNKQKKFLSVTTQRHKHSTFVVVILIGATRGYSASTPSDVCLHSDPQGGLSLYTGGSH